MIDREELANRRIDVAQASNIAQGAAGGLMMLLGMRRGGLIGALVKAGGAFALLRALSRTESVGKYLQLPLISDSASVRRNAIRVEAATEVECSSDELYRVWRDLDNLPAFMSKVLSVRELDATRSHWVVKGPAGTAVNFDAEIINDVPGRLIAWQTVDRSAVVHAGSVHFDTLDDGRTRVRVIMRYDPPAHGLGHVVATLLGDDPQSEVEEFLMKFKRIMETGTLPVSSTGAEVL